MLLFWDKQVTFGGTLAEGQMLGKDQTSKVPHIAGVVNICKRVAFWFMNFTTFTVTKWLTAAADGE